MKLKGSRNSITRKCLLYKKMDAKEFVSLAPEMFNEKFFQEKFESQDQDAQQQKQFALNN